MSNSNYKARFAGKTHNQSKTRWIITLDTNGAALDRLLLIHNSMQRVIDAEFNSQERQQLAMKAFLRKPVTTP